MATTSPQDSIQEMLIEADRVITGFIERGVHLDTGYRGMMYDPATGNKVPADTRTKELGLDRAVIALEQARLNGNFVYVNEEVKAVIEGALPDSPDMFYEPWLLLTDSGWMKFSKPIYVDLDGEPYDKVLWSRENESLTVVWISKDGLLLNYSTVMEQFKVTDVGLQTLFVALHVITQPIVITDSFKLLKPTHGRRKLRNVKSATVRMVVLRRSVHSNGGTGNGGSIEYHCRWTVQSHWRMQPYPLTKTVRPLLIAAYVKGPTNMPLKAPTKIIFIAKR